MNSCIKKENGKVTGQISVYTYQDKNHPGNVWIAYCPELDIDGSGYSEEEARQSFRIAMNDYLEYTLSEGTLEEDLIAHGWNKDSVGKMQEPPLKESSVQALLHWV